MTDLEGRLRAAMESAVASEQPPGNLIEVVRRRHRRHVRRAAVAGAASAAVVAVLIPAATGVLGRGPGPAGGHRPTVRPFTSHSRPSCQHAGPDQRGHQPARQADPPRWIVLWRIAARRMARPSTPPPAPRPPRSAPPPISPASGSTSRGYFTIDPDGKTGYAAGPVGRPQPTARARSPRSTSPPASQASRSASCSILEMIVFTPDGKTAYVTCPSTGPSTVIPVNTATNTPGKPIPVGPGPCHRHHPGREDRLRPGRCTRSPRSTPPPTRPASRSASGQTPQPSSRSPRTGRPPMSAPSARSSRSAPPPTRPAHRSASEPVSPPKTSCSPRTGRPPTSPTAKGPPAGSSRSARPPARPASRSASESAPSIAITPDGKTVYAAAHNKVVPISTATNTPGKPIRLPDGLPTWIVTTP